MRKARRAAPFFGLNEKMPILLGLLLGFQHALSMLAGVITPPIIIAGQGGANLGTDDAQYLVSTSLIVCGILSSIQITRFHIYKTPYYIGTGLISVVGTSFAIIPVATGAFAQMYNTGFCHLDASGNKLPCPEGYGAILGTACCCALLEILLSFTKPTVLRRIFPPLVTGPTVTLIGVSLIQSAFQGWAGGSGSPGCIDRPASGTFSVCPMEGAPHALPWGSAEYIGLGFSVFVTIIICERFGSPIMKSCAVVLGLLVGCIIAGATGYFSSTGIDAAPPASFIWVKTFPLSVYGPIVLPLLAVYIVLMMVRGRPSPLALLQFQRFHYPFSFTLTLAILVIDQISVQSTNVPCRKPLATSPLPAMSPASKSPVPSSTPVSKVASSRTALTVLLPLSAPSLPCQRNVIPRPGLLPLLF